MGNGTKLNDPVGKSEWRRRALVLERINIDIGAVAAVMEKDITNIIAILDGPTRLFGPAKTNLIENVIEKYRNLNVVEGADASADPKPEAEEPVALGVV